MWFCVQSMCFFGALARASHQASLSLWDKHGDCRRVKHLLTTFGYWHVNSRIRDKDMKYLSTKANVGPTVRLITPCHSSREENGCPRLHIRSMQEESEHNEQSQTMTTRLADLPKFVKK